MSRALAILSLAVIGSCMEVRETEQRMVMVTQTGSDLEPQAKGFIYKRESDKPAKVVKMAEDEVMEELTKIYQKPQAFKAPLPVAAGPFYNKEEDSSKAGSVTSESYVIPVKEEVEEAQDKHIPGATDDYAAFMKEHAANYDDYKSDFDEYLRSLGYGDGDFHGDEESSGEYTSDGNQKARDGSKADKNDDDYKTKKYQSYSIETGKSHKKEYGDSDSFGKTDEHSHDGKEFKGDDSKGKAINGFFIFDKDFNNDKFYGGAALGDFRKYGDGHDYDFEEYRKGDSLASKQSGDDHGDSGYHAGESHDDHGPSHSGAFHHGGSVDDSGTYGSISHKSEHR